MNATEQLIEAEKKASELFAEIDLRGLIVAGTTERELNQAIYDLAFELFGIKKYWHKRIVRSGRNTLLPYRENPPNLTLQADDILFLDFGPVFDDWEADFGRTYVIGDDHAKRKMQIDVESAWHEGKNYFLEHKETITGAQFYSYTKELAKKYGWEYGNEHCGHLIGNFPHERIVGEERIHYLHPDNQLLLSAKDQHGNDRHWIYEIHFVDLKLGFGGFFEQLMY